MIFYKEIDVNARAQKKADYARGHNSAFEKCEACGRLKYRHTLEEVRDCNRVRFASETAGVSRPSEKF